jgi:hypothetical protein
MHRSDTCVDVVDCGADPPLSLEYKNVDGIGRASLSKTDLEIIRQFRGRIRVN